MRGEEKNQLSVLVEKKKKKHITVIKRKGDYRFAKMNNSLLHKKCVQIAFSLSES